MALTNEQRPPEAVVRDASLLRAQEYPRRELPAMAKARENRYQVVIQQSVMNDIHAHGRATDSVEVCGVLLGTVYHDDKGPWCLVDASVRGNFSSGKQTQVTITSETWTHVNEVRDRLYPEKKFVGWYHTHPGFGIFLSGMDDFIQANWFAEPWQIALVYDPQNQRAGRLHLARRENGQRAVFPVARRWRRGATRRWTNRGALVRDKRTIRNPGGLHVPPAGGRAGASGGSWPDWESSC